MAIKFDPKTPEMTDPRNHYYSNQDVFTRNCPDLCSRVKFPIVLGDKPAKHLMDCIDKCRQIQREMQRQIQTP